MPHSAAPSSSSLVMRVNFTLSVIAALALSSACAVDLEASQGPLPDPKADTPLLVGTFPGPSGSLRAAYIIDGDDAVVGGDIRIPRESMHTGRAAAFATAQRWTGGVIPYVFEDKFSKKAEFEAAAATWNQQSAATGLTIRPRSNEANYVLVKSSVKKCDSYLGMLGTGAQTINVGADHCDAASIVHEIGHAIGLIHEHQRPQRGTYIKMNLDAVVGGAAGDTATVNFAVVKGALVQSPYDYYSIMHYTAYQGAVDYSSPVFTSLTEGVETSNIGQSGSLTSSDIAGVGKLYKGAGGGQAECANPCDIYGVAEGECKLFPTAGSFECTNGCLNIVAACEQDGGGNGQVDCVNPCADYGVAEGECQVFSNGAYECQNACLAVVDSCQQDGGGNGQVDCVNPCADYGVAEGECQVFSNGAYECQSACLAKVDACEQGGGGTNQTNCVNPCNDYGVAEGECRDFSNGSYQCQNACLAAVASCQQGGGETNQTDCANTCADYGVAEGECRDFSNGSYQCQGACLYSVATCGQSGGGLNGFSCGNGVTIQSQYRCDGFNDCGNQADEAGCGSNNTFICANGTVVSVSWLCDGDNDCGDSTDEAGCTNY